MRSAVCKVILALVGLGALSLGAPSAYAAGATEPATVHVKYDSGETELNHLAAGTKFFLDKRDTLRVFPVRLRRLMFTRRNSDQPVGVTINAPAGATVVLLNEPGDATEDCRRMVADAGWEQARSFPTVAGKRFDVYSQDCTDAVQLTLPAQGTCPVIVVAPSLVVDPPTGQSADAGASTRPVGETAATPAAAVEKTNPEKINPEPAAPPSPTVIELGGKVDQIRTGGGGHFLVFHVQDSNQLTVVDTLAEKVVKSIAVEGDFCYCMDCNKLVLILNNQQVIQRWDLATITREKTVMLPDDQLVKRAVMGSTSRGPLMMWTDGGCKLFNVETLKALNVSGTVQKNLGFGPWVSPDGMTVCDWGWSSGPYSLMQLSNLTATNVDSRVVNVDGEDYNESWAMRSADGTQLIRHGAKVYDASTDDLGELAPGPLKDSTVLPTEDPRFLLAVRGEREDDKTSSVAILSALDRRVLYTLRKAVPVTGGMIETASDRVCNEPRVHYLPADNKLIVIRKSDDKVVIYSLDLAAALKATGADYLYVISKPRTVVLAGQQWDYQIQTLSSAGGVKFKLEQGPDRLTLSNDGSMSWRASASAGEAKVPIVITLPDASGQEITHAIELHVMQKTVPNPEAPAGTPRDSTASAGDQSPTQSRPPAGTPTVPSPKKVPDDPNLKAVCDKLAKKLQNDLNGEVKDNNEYTSTFSVTVVSAHRTLGPGGSGFAGSMKLEIVEDRAFLAGGDFISYHSHLDIQLIKEKDLWTCWTAKATLYMATGSQGPLDLPYPVRAHDMTNSMKSLLDDVQNNPAAPGTEPPAPQPDVPARPA